MKLLIDPDTPDEREVEIESATKTTSVQTDIEDEKITQSIVEMLGVTLVDITEEPPSDGCKVEVVADGHRFLFYDVNVRSHGYTWVFIRE